MKKKLLYGFAAMICNTFLGSSLYAQKTFKITGSYSSDIKTPCNCSQGSMQGSIIYYYNSTRTLLNICTPPSQMMEGQEITIEGSYQNQQCNTNAFLFPGNFAAKPSMLSGIFETANYKCPIVNEGRIVTDDNKSFSITSSKPIPPNTKIRVTEGGWGIKFCEGAYYQIYHVVNFETGEKNKAISTYSGNFRSVKGVRDPASTIGYNIGYLETTATKGGASESFLVCFDRMPNGQEIETFNHIKVDGYVETISGYKVLFVTKYYK